MWSQICRFCVFTTLWVEHLLGFEANWCFFLSHVRWEKVESDTFLAAQQQKHWKTERMIVQKNETDKRLCPHMLTWRLLRSMFSVFCVFITSKRRFSKGTFIVYMNVAASFFFFFILRGGFNWSLLGSLSLARFCSPLCSGGREIPKDQSKVNVDCVCFNLSILRKKKKKENLTQQSNLFLRRQPTVVFSPLSPSLPPFF